MYEKEIEYLTDLRDRHIGRARESCDTALALMRAAARAEGFAAGEQHQITVNDSLRGQLTDVQFRLAAVRAPMQARIDKLETDLALLCSAAREVVSSDAWDDVSELPEALVQSLDALQAALDAAPETAPETAGEQIGTLLTACEDFKALLVKQTHNLTALRAENAELRAEVEDLRQALRDA